MTEKWKDKYDLSIRGEQGVSLQVAIARHITGRGMYADGTIERLQQRVDQLEQLINMLLCAQPEVARQILEQNGWEEIK